VTPKTPTLNDKKLEFLYDYMGRRVRKITSSWDGSTWQSDEIRFFVYDGWNLIEELDGTGAVTASYVHGIDLSQSLQGAGGIGGILARIDHGASKAHIYFYDANGNVGQLVDVADGSIVAAYEYAPFGELTSAMGTYAETNPFRFSTKYSDDVAGLYYYGYRYYSPELGRWLSRDSAEEDAGANIYAFLLNDGVNFIDYLGMIEWDSDCKCYLSEEERNEIEGYLSGYIEKISFELDAGWELDNILYVEYSSDVLTADMAHKILDKYDELCVNCVSKYHPLSWGMFSADGFGILGTNTAYISTFKTRDLAAISRLVLHETIHLAGKFGHNPPDNPYKWAFIDKLVWKKNIRKEYIIKVNGK
jgi:RHS repeat-associated protein